VSWFFAVLRKLQKNRHVPDNWIMATATTLALDVSAWMIFQLCCSKHITGVFASLHWLFVPECIQYMIAMLTYKVHHGTESDLLGWRCLRAARLLMPPLKFETVQL